MIPAVVLIPIHSKASEIVLMIRIRYSLIPGSTELINDEN